MEAISNRMLVNEVPQPETTTAPKNIAYRGRNDLERIPGEDEYTGKKKHKGGKTLLGIIAAAAVALGITCFVKGKKAGAEKFGEKMTEGWKEVRAKGTELWENLKNKLKRNKAEAPAEPAAPATPETPAA